MKANLSNDAVVRNLPLADKPYYCMSDDKKEKGFGVLVYPTGSMTFVFRYKIDGTQKLLKLGEYPKEKLAYLRAEYLKASLRVKDLRRGSADGVDPVAKIKREKLQRIAEAAAQSQLLTVSELITEYIDKHAKPNKRGWKEDKRILDHDALPVWGKRKAADITKRDVVLLLERIVERGSPGSANNNFKIIRKMFTFAVERDILQQSPCVGVKMPAPLIRKDRYLDENEIRIFWNNLDSCHVSDDVRRALKLILLTGQRPGEVIGMHTDEIDGTWWTIPVERSKNKRAHHVYLTASALELIGELKVLDEKTNEMKPKGFIFPTPLTKKIQHIENTVPAQAIRRNLAVPVLVNGKPVFDKKGNPITENKLGVADFTPHDLRRTCATFMSKIGFMDETIDAVLNHTKQGIIRTYNVNRYDKEIQQALESWERKLNSIITGSESKVIPISRRAA